MAKLLPKEYLNFEDLAEYLNNLGFEYDVFESWDRQQLESDIVDLVTEKKLKPCIHYTGHIIKHTTLWGKGINIERTIVDIDSKFCIIDGFLYTDSEMVKKMNRGRIILEGVFSSVNDKSSEEKGITYEIETLAKIHPQPFDIPPTESTIYFSDLRYKKSDLDRVFKPEQLDNQETQIQVKNKELNTRLEKAKIVFKDQQTEINKLKTDNDQANATIAELQKQLEAKENTPTSNQPINGDSYQWENLNKHKYPPELHLAMMLWEKIYINCEIENAHVDNHSDRFNIIAKQLGLSKEAQSQAMVDRLQTITTPQANKTTNDVNKLNSIKTLYLKGLNEGNPTP